MTTCIGQADLRLQPTQAILGLNRPYDTLSRLIEAVGILKSDGKPTFFGNILLTFVALHSSSHALFSGQKLR